LQYCDHLPAIISMSYCLFHPSSLLSGNLIKLKLWFEFKAVARAAVPSFIKVMLVSFVPAVLA